MKKRLTLFLAAAALAVMTVGAQTFESGPLKYTVTSGKNVRVEGYSSNPQLDLVIPSTVDYNSTTYTVTEIAGLAFGSTQASEANGKPNITSVTIPSTVTTIGRFAFAYKTSLTSLTLNEGLKDVGVAAFYTTGITELTVPKTVTELGAQCFSNMKLTTATLTPGINYGNSVYLNNLELTSATIEEGITLIPNYVFGDCKKLSQVTCNCMTPPALGATPFMNMAPNCVLLVPADALAAYKTNTAYTSLFSDIRAGSTQSEDDYNAAIVEMLNASKVLLTNPVNLKFKVRNQGKQTITSLTGVLTIDGDAYPAQTIEGLSIEPDAVATVIVPVPLNEATYEMSLNITQVNGEPNANPNPVFNFTLQTVKIEIPENAPEATKADFKGTEYYGWYDSKTQKAAIMVNDPNMAGRKVIGAKMIGLKKDVVENVKIWSTTKLDIFPDIDNLDVTWEGDEAKVTFVNPVTLGDAGIYYGVSVDVADGKTWGTMPVSGGSHENSFFYSYGALFINWSHYGSLQMVLILDNDEESNSVAIQKCNVDAAVGRDQSLTLPFTVANYSAKPVNLIEYSYTVNGQTVTKSQEVNLNPYVMQPQTIYLSMDPISKSGNHDVTLTLTRINGNPNTAVGNKSITFPVTVGEFQVTHQPIMEEYTGTTCGYCPRGTLAMAQMAQRVPGFIGLAYHKYNPDDPMYLTPELPFDQDGAPSAVIDRNGVILDPYFGDNHQPMGIADYYALQAMQMAPASLSMTCLWDEQLQGFKVDGTAKFSYVNPSETYKIGLVMTVDSLRGEGVAWEQYNFYKNPTPDDSLLNTLSTGGSFDLSVYNHVVFDQKNGLGFVTIPASEITVGQDITFSTQVTQPSSLAEQSTFIPTSAKNVNAIAILLDSKGKVLNAVKVAATNSGDSPSSVNQITSDETTAPVYYDLQGRRINHPQNGIYVRRQGTKVEKILL